MSDFERQLRDYRLTTVDLTYRMPDHPDLLQSFLWQCLDVPPSFPAVERFLAFWRHSIEARLHCVRIVYAAPLTDGRWSRVEELRTLH